MPLIHGKSKKAFGENVATEMHHGHPLKQSLAIAYSVKRKAQHKKAHGGEVNTDRSEESHKMSGHSGLVRGSRESGHEKGIHKKGSSGRSGGISEAGYYHRSGQHGYKSGKEKSKQIHHENLAELKSMPKPKIQGLAHGGMLTHSGYQPKADHHYDADFADMHHDEEELASGYVGHEGAHAKHNAMAMHEDHKSLNQHGEDEIGPEGKHHAHGGEIHPHQSEAHEKDMVGKIMAKRQHMYSKGGQVANDDHPFEYEFEEPNQFDQLVKGDDLEFHYTGKNSGDELSDAREDHDRHDIVSKIMKSRAKKDKLPPHYGK